MARTQPLTHRNENPEYAAALAEINKLNTTLVPVVGAINELALRLQASTTLEDRNAGHIDAAMHFVETGVVRRSQDSESLREDHMRLREQAEALTTTITQKTQALYSLEQRLSAEALAASAADLKEMRDRYVAKLRELDAIAMEERAYLNALGSKGYAPTITKPISWPLLGTLDDPQSAISARMREIR